MPKLSLADHRRFYAEELRAAAPVLRNDAVVKAFAKVPREKFFGPGPWLILPPKSMQARYQTPDADPRHLYHDVLIAIDRQKGINNGEPGLWARLFDAVDVVPGERILQVGAGTGYYTAILAEMTGRKGNVVAVEYEAALAKQARRNLGQWKQVKIVHGDGTKHDAGEVDLVVVFAGATHPAKPWLERLKDGGRLLMPLTGQNGWGIFLKAIRRGRSFEVESLGVCGFFPCVGGRDEIAARNLYQHLRALRGRPAPIRALHIGKPRAADKSDVWYQGPGFWLSRK